MKQLNKKSFHPCNKLDTKVRGKVWGGEGWHMKTNKIKLFVLLKITSTTYVWRIESVVFYAFKITHGVKIQIKMYNFNSCENILKL